MNANYEVKQIGHVLNDCSAFGVADGRIGIHIYAIDITNGIEGAPIVAGNSPFRLKLKMNGDLIRTIENIPACVTPENLNINELEGPVEWNCIIDQLPKGDYTWVIEDSLTPVPNDCRMMLAFFVDQPPTAIIPGDANAMGYPTQVFIDYGLTEQYDKVAQLGIINGFATVPFHLELKSVYPGAPNPNGYLLPDTTYHYRIRATNANGTAVSVDMTFTTPGAPPAPIPVVHIYPAIIN